MGVEWIDLLFGGLARYVREHVHADYETRLITAYVHTAATKKAHTLTIEELLKQTDVESALRNCVTTAFEVPGAPASIAKDVCDTLNEFITQQTGIKGPNVCKVNENETFRFLTLLPRHLTAMLNALQQAGHVAESPILVA